MCFYVNNPWLVTFGNDHIEKVKDSGKKGLVHQVNSDHVISCFICSSPGAFHILCALIISACVLVVF